MGVLNSENLGIFKDISNCLYQNTISGSLVWEEPSSIIKSDCEKVYETIFLDQKFQIKLTIYDSKLDRSILIIFDDKFDDGFIFHTLDSDDKISKILFEKYRSKFIDKESDDLHGILGKIGKDYLREKRLSKLLDDVPDSMINGDVDVVGDDGEKTKNEKTKRWFFF